MSRMPLYKEAYQLAKEYEKHGIKYVYNQRNKLVYLSIAAAPLFVPNTSDCHLVGHLIVYGGVVASRDIEKWVDAVKMDFVRCWKDNPELLKYADTII